MSVASFDPTTANTTPLLTALETYVESYFAQRVIVTDITAEIKDDASEVRVLITYVPTVLPSEAVISAGEVTDFTLGEAA